MKEILLTIEGVSVKLRNITELRSLVKNIKKRNKLIKKTNDARIASLLNAGIGTCYIKKGKKYRVFPDLFDNE